MADSRKEATLPDGRPIESLRVVELKQELKKHGLSNSGTKSQLVERLKAQIYLEELKQAPITGGVPNENIVEDESVASNSFIQQYLKQQQEQLKARGRREEENTVPEVLTSQVDELNQSPTQDSSEKPDGSEKPDTEVGDTAESTMPIKEPVDQEVSNTRSSRRSRRQTAPQEEKAEPEPDTRKSKRRRSRSKDSEHEEEAKVVQDAEPMETIEEKEKPVNNKPIPDTADEGEPVEKSIVEAAEGDETSQEKGSNENQTKASKDDDDQIEAQEGQATIPNESSNGDNQDSVDGKAKEECDDTKQAQMTDPGTEKEDPQKQEMEVSPVEEQSSSTARKENEERMEEIREVAIEVKGVTSEVGSDSTSEKKGEMEVLTEKNSPEEEKAEKENLDDSTGSGNPVQKRIRLNRSSDLRRVRGASNTEAEEKPSETGVQEEMQVEEEQSGSGEPDPSPKESAPAQDEEDDGAEAVPPKRKKLDPEVEEGDGERMAAREEEKMAESEEKGTGDEKRTGEEESTGEKDAGPVESEEGEIQNGDGGDEGEGEQVVGNNKEGKQEDASQVEQPGRSKTTTSVSAPIKTKRLSFSSKEKSSERDGQEGSSSATEPVVKKRRWGSTKKPLDDKSKKTNVNISTELLKEIIPDIKVAASEVLSMEEEEEVEQGEVEGEGETAMETDRTSDEVPQDSSSSQKEEEAAAEAAPKRKFVRHTITAPGVEKKAVKAEEKDEESDIDFEDDELVTRRVEAKADGDQNGEKEADGEEEEEKQDRSQSSDSEDEGNSKEPGEDDEPAPKKPSSNENAHDSGEEEEKEKEEKPKSKPAVIRLKTNVRAVIDEPIRAKREASPAKRPENKIVHVNNLVRPFTVNQLKELLGRYGSLASDGFWINNIKSHCYATYESCEEAAACRSALHGTTWPSSNPKTLRVEFADENELNRFMGVTSTKKEVPKEPAAPEEPAAVKRERISRHDRERDQEQERRTRERERERERAQKEREWDRGKDKDRSPPGERRRRQRSEERKDRHKEIKKEIEEPPAKLLDDLFRKTKATPCIYWLPLTDEQIAEREQTKVKRVEKREVQEDRLPRDARDIRDARDARDIRDPRDARDIRDRSREDRDKRQRERPRPRAREPSWSRERRSRSRSRGRRR